MLTLASCNGTRAGRTYTPVELKALIDSGKYPPQGEPTTQTKEMEFAACVATIDQVAGAVGENYPTQVLVNTGIMRLQKIWTNDAAVTVTCSAPDRKMVITSAKYL
jgi:hypothetical protein